MIRKAKNWLKRHFIPHEENAYRPHFLHRKNSKQLLGIVLLFELILFILPGLNFVRYFEDLNLGSVLPGVLSNLTNSERGENNLPALTENAILNRAAQMKAEDMAKKSYFAHTSPEGITPWYWLEKAGYSYLYAGENLAINFIDSEDVTEAWMNSPTHRANIIHGAYTEVGTGVAVGTYQGYETIFVAQVYARPRAVNTSVAQYVNTSPVPPKPANRNLAVQVPPPEPAQTVETNAEAEVLGQAEVQSAPAKANPVNRVTQETIKEFFQQAAASPRHTADAVFYSVMTIVTLALLFNIFIKIRHQHPDLILNGAVVVVVILGLHIANSYISKEQSLQTSFIAYDSQAHILNQE